MTLDAGSANSASQIPSTRPKPFVFILMPFADAFNDIYELGIKAACQLAGAYCERVDEQVFDGSILERVYHQISSADLIVADMSGRNPNVFYEVGYAHALGKRVILLTQSADDIPFDLQHFQHIVYGDSITTLRDRLAPVIDYYLDRPDAPATDIFRLIRFYINRQELQQNGSINIRTSWTQAYGNLVSLELAGQNTSEMVLDSTFPLAISVSPNEQVILYRSKSMLVTDQGEGICELPAIGRLFPNQWWRAHVSFEIVVHEGYEIELNAKLSQHGPIQNQQLDFRLFCSIS